MMVMIMMVMMQERSQDKKKEGTQDRNLFLFIHIDWIGLLYLYTIRIYG